MRTNHFLCVSKVPNPKILEESTKVLMFYSAGWVLTNVTIYIVLTNVTATLSALSKSFITTDNFKWQKKTRKRKTAKQIPFVKRQPFFKTSSKF